MPLITGKNHVKFCGFGAVVGARRALRAGQIPLRDKELYTLTEVAELLSVSRDTVTRAITIKRRSLSPLLRTVTVGTAIRVSRADLNNYVAALRIAAGISTL